MRGLCLLLVVILAACGNAPSEPTREISAEEISETDRPAVPDGKSLRDAIGAHNGKEPSADVRFAAATVDLNGDGSKEAVVYWEDPLRCGSGGCNTYVLAQTAANGWRVTDRLTVSRLPIYRLPPGEDGWAELGVSVSGGGLAHMVMAVPHTENGYQPNPTVPPARSIDPREAEVLISREALLRLSDG